MNKNSNQLTRSIAAIFVVAALQAGVAQADTFRIEIDYMGSDGSHDHQPSQMVLDTVIQMFACQGHTLIIDLDDQIPHCDVLLTDPETNCGNFWSYDGDPCTAKAIKDANFDHANDADPWFYCIFAHQYQSLNSDDPPICVTSGSSGRSDGGQNLVITLGNFDGQTGTEFVQAATLAHEFGHNLGLSHCGTMNCASNTDDDTPNWVGPRVPNLPSVMSYRYQLVGVRTQALMFGLVPDEALFKEIDYSHGRMCSLDEDNLDETVGTVMSPVDWNCDNVLSGAVAQDVNGASSGWCGSTGNRTLLNDYNEWANLSPGVGGGGDGGAPLSEAELEERRRKLDADPCITAQEWAQVRMEIGMPRGSGPPLMIESCIDGVNVYLSSSSVGIMTGQCELPFDSVGQAQLFSPSDSVYFFRPGTYDEANGLVLDKTGIYISAIGSSVIE